MSVEQDGEMPLRVLPIKPAAPDRRYISFGQAAQGKQVLPDPPRHGRGSGGDRPAARYYFEEPYFPERFVCGTNREPGDGLRIFRRARYSRTVHCGRSPWTLALIAGPQGPWLPEVVLGALDGPGRHRRWRMNRPSGEDPAFVLGR